MFFLFTSQFVVSFSTRKSVADHYQGDFQAQVMKMTARHSRLEGAEYFREVFFGIRRVVKIEGTNFFFCFCFLYIAWINTDLHFHACKFVSFYSRDKLYMQIMSHSCEKKCNKNNKVFKVWTNGRNTMWSIDSSDHGWRFQVASFASEIDNFVAQCKC